ncbi:MAG: UDP-N-acetylmuramoyl-tripeptide--D-alanyl-D-alanine ligase [Candidatus Cybelea sp.]
MRLPLDRAVAASNATLFEGDVAPDSLRVSTDSRRIEPGDTFVALHGERFDGHDFAAQAVGRGAALLVLDRPSARVAGVPAMLVDRTNDAYVEFARVARELFHGRVVAITGSTGKTTTKAFLAQLCRTQFGDRVLAAPGNENNEIGVSKLLLNASNEAHDIVIAEMGARSYGDVAILVEIARPHVGILTNIGEAHVEIMGSRERLAETKWALFSKGASAVLNAGDEVSIARATTLTQPPRWFAAVAKEPAPELSSSFDQLTALVGERCLLARDRGTGSKYEIHAHVPGLHNRANLAAAIAGALQLGVSLERLIPAIPALHLPQGRYDSIAIEGGPRVIYDAYNANASGMIAALNAFAGETASRRIAVLASMAELGDESQSLHERVGAHAASTVDVLLVSGDFAAALARGARRAGLDASQIVPVRDNSHAAAWLREHATGDDVILLKGSRKYKLEEIVEELHA